MTIHTFLEFFMKTLMSLLSILYFILLMVASNSQADDSAINLFKDERAIAGITESIYGLEIKKSQLHVKMISNGCTTVDSFKLVWSEENQLTISRVKPDHCRRMPVKKWFIFDVPANIKTFTVNNPFSDK